MSIPKQMNVNCSNCNNQMTVTVFQSVNTDYADDIAEQIISGKLFEVTCPKCGTVSHLEYDILYNDIRHNAIIWVLHKTNEYEERLAEARSSIRILSSVTRIVENVNALREKVMCLENNRDDRVIELCKVFTRYALLAEKPDFFFKNAYYVTNGGTERICLYDIDDNETTCNLQDKLYDDMKEMYYKSDYATQFDEHYPIVDYEWAEPITLSLVETEAKRIDASSETTDDTKEQELFSLPNEMITCPQCNQALPSDSEFCQYCGTRVYSQNWSPNLTVTTDTLSSQVSKVQSATKKTKKKGIICFTAITVAILLSIALIIFILIPGLQYSHAKKLLETGNYELAYSEFLALGDFGDSEKMLLESRYVQAIKYRDAGDYEVANKIFASLGNYRDSQILIHQHDYRMIHRLEPSCTEAGTERFECTGCKDSYTNHIEASHDYILLQTIDATCSKTGSNQYKCTVCDHEVSEMIAKKTHDYSPATCTSPKICKMCENSEGMALGHSNSVICTRCGITTFETLTYSGVGSDIINNITLPSGTFRMTCTLHSGAYTTMYFHCDGNEYLVFNHYDPNYSEITSITGPITNCSMVINGESDFSSKAKWSIKIEAVSN